MGGVTDEIRLGVCFISSYQLLNLGHGFMEGHYIILFFSYA